MSTAIGAGTHATPSNGASYDVVIIGGGAAGLGGALTLARARRSVLVVDAGQPRNTPAKHMHNFLSRDGTPPSEFLALGRAEVTSYGGLITTGRVIGVERQQAEDLGFHMTLSDGTFIYARRLLLATGVVDQLPDIPGVAERWGRDVLHCPYCHGWEVRDQAIGILATGLVAVHTALLFRQWSADIVFFQHTAPPLSTEQSQQLRARGITIVDGEVSSLEIQQDRLTGVWLRSGAFFPLQAAVVSPRSLVQNELLPMLGIETKDLEFAGTLVATAVVTDLLGATNVPGVWAAGNITDPSAQVIAAASAGLRAGAAINADLIAEETARAVAQAFE